MQNNVIIIYSFIQLIIIDYYFKQGTFAIHSETGSLTVADVLDWEIRHSYVLVIEAWDNYQFGYTAGESRNAFKQIQYVLISKYNTTLDLLIQI